jgi:hypothetical protein
VNRLLFSLALVAGPVPAFAGVAPEIRRQAQAQTPEEAQALDRAVTEALEADRLPDSSIAHITERIKRWSFVLVRAAQGSNDSRLAGDALARAQRDLKLARTQALQDGRIDSGTKQVVAAKLAAAETAIRTGDWAQAEQEIRSVLDQSPNYPVALSLLDELQRKKRASDIKRFILIGAIGLLLVAGVTVAVTRFGKRVQRGGPGTASPLGRRASIQIVEGVGRGRECVLESDRAALRIGAAMGATLEEQNDLVISDRNALVSRYHCSIVRDGDRLYLIDASTNGTAVNGRWLTRGVRAELADGDLILITDAAQLKLSLS